MASTPPTGAWPERAWHQLVAWLLAQPFWLRALLLFAAVGVSHGWLYEHSSFYWYLPGGLRFILLLLLPWRYWPAIICGEYYGRFTHDGLSFPIAWIYEFWGKLSQPLSSLPVLWWLKRRWQVQDIEVPRGMWLLLLGIVLNGVANTAANFIFVWITPVLYTERNILNWVVTAFVGATDVALVFTPAAAVALLGFGDLFRKPGVWRDLAAAAGFVLLLLLVTGLGLDRGGLRHDYLPLLMPLPMVYFAYRYGWRGATLALLMLALAESINIRGGVFPGINSRNLLLLDLSGFMALLLGSAIDAQRSGKRQLARRNRELRELGIQLQKAARRNLLLEERQIKRVVGALHDELGQNLTALRTQLKLAEPELVKAGVAHVGKSLSGQVDRMRQSVRALMNGLRPAALDDLGLIAVLRTGPIAEFVEQAGVRYSFSLAGDGELVASLHPELATAVYRIAQECATNCVRHARARHLELRLLLTRHHGQLMVVLEVQDDGIGLLPDKVTTGGGRGLQGIRDRVMAFEGVIHLKKLEERGTRIRVLLLQ